ncbi:hypothetical protein D3C87_1541320 [compost metagenome]
MSVVSKLVAVSMASAPMTNSLVDPFALAADTALSVTCVSVPSGNVKPSVTLSPSSTVAGGAGKVNSISAGVVAKSETMPILAPTAETVDSL